MQVILLSDGSVTRHLQLMTGCPVSVRVLGMKNIDRNTPGLPEAVSLLKEDYLTQRQVTCCILLCTVVHGWLFEVLFN